ncbi:mRNA-capping enzyme [Episyrphus balteatus]|uniref:mRNA-capping enzyme n=1 Tax=Episyrphus balteatus TaxID=286459 RepID=UPI002486BD8E|nr:mRNA-capping enzyme [Episyrphus balteatus]
MSNRRGGGGGPGPLPNRWLHCPRKSENIIADKFIAFKTPLSNKFKDQMPLDCMFPPEMIFGYVKALKLKLGLWIDLTNTKRFYDREVIESKGATYVKLQCRGHGETPSIEQSRSFIEIVDNFINERPFDLVAVHCTHGFNRTGFLIVSYMVERLDCSVQAALSAFSDARPPGIYKQDYIQELFRRYDDEEDAPQAPALPDWCFDFDDSDGNGPQKRQLEDEPETNQTNTTENGVGAAADGSEKASNSKKKRRKEVFIKDAQFMSGVSGVVLVTDEPRLGELQLKVQNMCGWENSGFPGAQPVSMDRKNLNFLAEKPYMVSWKADGTRYMMLINKKDEVYFFDRNHSCFQVDNVSFPQRENLMEGVYDTLLDGEMVIDKVQGQNIPRYLVYDVVQFQGNPVGKMSFKNRLKYIKSELIDPRYEAFSKGIVNRLLESFSVRNKEFWDITKAASLLDPKFTRCLPHEPDGLIFQPVDEPYTAGVCKDILKWKPLSLNSVDFKLKIVMESRPGMIASKVGLLYAGGMDDQSYAQMKYTKDLKDLNGKIVECTVKNGQWTFLRERTDKTHPNSFKTANSVIESIRNPVTKEILLSFIEENRYRHDIERMPPPPPAVAPDSQRDMYNNYLYRPVT